MIKERPKPLRLAVVECLFKSLLFLRTKNQENLDDIHPTAASSQIKRRVHLAQVPVVCVFICSSI